MSLHGERDRSYNYRSIVNRLSARGCWIERLMQWAGHGAVLCRDVATYMDMPFFLRTEEETYASRLALIGQRNSDLANTAPANHILGVRRIPTSS